MTYYGIKFLGPGSEDDLLSRSIFETEPIVNHYGEQHLDDWFTDFIIIEFKLVKLHSQDWPFPYAQGLCLI